MDYQLILVDEPRPKNRRITLNRPDKRNPLSNALRGELFDALERADRDDDVAVIVIRGAGTSFCAGYDLKTNVTEGQPWHTAGGLGNWPRHVVEGCFRSSRAAGRGRDARLQTVRPRAAATRIAGPLRPRLTLLRPFLRTDARLA